jgi:hypothetical protein
MLLRDPIIELPLIRHWRMFRLQASILIIMIFPYGGNGGSEETRAFNSIIGYGSMVHTTWQSVLHKGRITI